MIRKIVSGGQTGADQAALDVAIAMGIAHGGWIPKGRKTESGPLAKQYRLQELPSQSYPRRTEQNVIDSDGTLIFSHGPLTGGSALTRDFAETHHRPWLHMDLLLHGGFAAAEKVQRWVSRNRIETLNVAGPRASSDPDIYQKTVEVLETVIHLEMTNPAAYDPFPLPGQDTPGIAVLQLPETVDQAVDLLMGRLSLREKSQLSNMSQTALTDSGMSLGVYIQGDFRVWAGNQQLIQSCCEKAGRRNLDPDEAVFVILKSLWERLRNTHAIRRVK